jgi:hypothetical protein
MRGARDDFEIHVTMRLSHRITIELDARLVVTIGDLASSRTGTAAAAAVRKDNQALRADRHAKVCLQRGGSNGNLHRFYRGCFAHGSSAES